jgi:hypothetical protein
VYRSNPKRKPKPKTEAPNLLNALEKTDDVNEDSTRRNILSPKTSARSSKYAASSANADDLQFQNDPTKTEEEAKE